MENPIDEFSVSRLKFVWQGLNLSGGSEWCHDYFEKQDSENECVGVVGCIQGCKLNWV